MASQRTIVGAHLKLYINGQVFTEVQQISYTLDYGEEPIYGIDSVFPQEIKITRVSVQGSVSGLRVANSNGLQGRNVRPEIRESLFAPYISIRVYDRRTGEDIMFIPNAKVTNEKTDISAKGVVKVNFNFTGLQLQQPLDR
jgi:hypothetical protein